MNKEINEHNINQLNKIKNVMIMIDEIENKLVIQCDKKISELESMEKQIKNNIDLFVGVAKNMI